MGARNALLQWCKEVITPKFGIHVDNFGASWRDGRAFVALISALNPGKQTATGCPTWIGGHFKELLVIGASIFHHQNQI